MEFRVIVTHPINDGDVVYLNWNSNIQPMQPSSRGFHHLFVPMPTQDMKYKYFIIRGEKQYPECLPGRRPVRILYNVDQDSSVTYDVANFTLQNISKRDWGKNIDKYIGCHLPHANDVKAQQVSIKWEIFTWLDWMKRGWGTTHTTHCCDAEVIEKAFSKWLTSILKEEHVTTCVMCALSIAVATYYVNHPIGSPELLLMIFHLLQIVSLDEHAQQLLYSHIYYEFSSPTDRQSDDVSKALLKVIEAMPWLPSTDRILVLPLYWILSQQGQVAMNQPGFPSCMSKDENGAWKEMKKAMGGSTEQGKLVQIAFQVEKFASQQPEFAYTYLYLLTNPTLIELISENAPVCYLFRIDSIFTRMLQLLMHTKTTKKFGPKILATQDFLTARFETLTPKSVSESTIEELSCRVSMGFSILKELRCSLLKLSESKPGKSKKIVLWIIKMTCEAANWSSHLLGLMSKQHPQEIRKLLHDVLSVTKDWVLKKPRCNKKGIDLFDGLLRLSWTDQEFCNKWQTMIQAALEQSTEQEWTHNGTGFLKFYFSEIKDTKFCKKLAMELKTKAVRCTREALMEKDTPDIQSLFHPILSCFGTQGSPMSVFSDTFMKDFKKFHQEGSDAGNFKMDAIRFLLSSPMPLKFYQVFYGNSVVVKHFPNDFWVLVKRVAQVMLNLIDSFPTASITKAELDILTQNEERMLALLSYFESLQRKGKKPQQHDNTDYSYAIKLFQGKWEEYVRQCETFKTFINICSSLDQEGVAVYYPELKSVYERDPSTLKICELHSGFPASKEMEELFLVTSLKDSHVFLSMFKRNAIAEKKNINWHQLVGGKWKLNWKKSLKIFWSSTKDALCEFLHSMDQGTILSETVLSTFEFSRGDISQIHIELLCLYTFYCRVRGNLDVLTSEVPLQKDIASIVTVKAAQICSIFELQKSKEILEWIALFKDKNKLHASFEALDKLQSFGDISIDIVEQFSTLAKMDRDHLDVLKAFSKQQNLIDWLQEKMKDENGVRVLCTMAMESTREVPLHMDRWSCLSDGVACFEPLIFRLDKILGMEDLMNRCEEVWWKVEADRTLVEKWTDAGKCIEWYKENERLYGADEKTSLKYAQDVNERGVYTIGNLYQSQNKKMDKDGNEPFVNGDFDEMTLQNSVSLKLKQKDEKKEDTADLTSLHDIESKLMLIAGDEQDGQKDVNHFVNLLKAVESLAQAYVNLIRAGCMLFSEWTAVISSLRRQETTSARVEHELTINVSFKGDISPLTESTSLQDINTLSAIFRDTCQRWNIYLDKKRLKHYHLNDYNIQQTKYLCSKLAMIERKPLPDKAYVLLSSEPKSSITGLIQDALNDATRIIDAEEDDQEDLNDETISADDADTRKANIARKKKAVRVLMQIDNVAETLAKAAVQATPDAFQNIADCSNWILLNEFQEKTVQRYSEEFDRDVGFVHDQNEVQAIISILQNRSAMDLGTLISQLQNEANKKEISLLESVKTICMGYLANTSILTLQNYLSVEHLGRFLTIFRNNESKLQQEAELQRKFRPMHSLKKGRPNFIICQQQDILPAVLSFYLSDPDDEKADNGTSTPLPTLSEVLVCCEDTTQDEVERFMRRAMCTYPGRGQLLFCLAFAEKLPFNVCKAAEGIFNRLSRDKEHACDDYLMVILSSDQQHYLSNCFDKYQIEMPELKESEITDYLVCQFVKSMENQDGAIIKVVSSERSGVGKSLYIKRIIDGLLQKRHVITVRLLEKHINNDHVIQRLYQGQGVCNEDDHFVHIDLTPAVEQGIDKFMFDFLILGGIQDSSGRLWRRQRQHFYAIEMTSKKPSKNRVFPGGILTMLPEAKCLSPCKVLMRLQSSQIPGNEVLMDELEYLSETFQRPYQYLKRYNNKQSLLKYQFSEPEGSVEECLSTLVKECGMANPSWAQLKYFASFLNVQLKSCEESVFCQMTSKEDEELGLMELKEFAVRFMIQMSQDFATPSLNTSDKSQKDTTENENEELEVHQIRRRWEENDHPYVFFNEDRVSMTFINVHINDKGHLLDKEGKVVEERIASKALVQGLTRQGVHLRHDFHLLSREEKLQKLRTVMGITTCNEPDSTYELTTENVLKMLAIHMRFRCQIPVIIMGETGCGKTRMIEFMSKLKAGIAEKPKGRKNSVEENNVEETQENQELFIPRNMVTLKIHGGIEVSDIYRSVRSAKLLAGNIAQRGLSMVLFFDEANTTTAIHAIKEVMCDCTVDGESFEDAKLQIVAACNPYKKLSKAAIDSLESSGLGYRIKTSETNERLGNIPMRTLVYRVVALPPSIQPFVWDFGQLGDEAEMIYIQQMTARLQEELNQTKLSCSRQPPKFDSKDKKIIDVILSCAQKYMRKQQHECRYVSLRDVERTISIFRWFFNHRECFFEKLRDQLKRRYSGRQSPPDMEDVIRCLLQAVGISYHASLENRAEFRKEISKALFDHGIELSQYDLNEELVTCQTIFLQNLKMEDNIAQNEALRENVFLMTVCSDMKLPLYVIGKPGSSKSLAKTIVETNMKGTSSSSELYRKFKKVETFSYQCSALTEASGIKKMFEVASARQRNRAHALKDFSAVVVLDEIGLAEDSEHMPLKILHPLLECGSTTGGTLTDIDPVKKVGFIGISNWALDPAKMNRGIFVSRNIPSEDDLITTAKGIFHDKVGQVNQHYTTLESLTKTYTDVYKNQGDQYFGLRDYYSLIKMFHARCEDMTTREKENEIIRYTLLRNFSGGSPRHQTAFNCAVHKHLQLAENWTRGITVKRMVQDNLKSHDSRYLMLLTSQHSSVTLLQHIIADFDKSVQVIFGSSFPGDHTYTEICKNINRIKICMEKGRTAILLNLPEIHESLYDLLNQHYAVFGGQKYVSLGLGGHRLWCRVADEFRIIVIEKKEKVHKEYPIPLINRLEKHDLLCQNLLNDTQSILSQRLSAWVKKFSKSARFGECDAYVGFHDDSVSAVVLASEVDDDMNKCVTELLLWSCADAVFRLPETELGQNEEELDEILSIYCETQAHDSLLNLLTHTMKQTKNKISVLEVISFSNILTEEDRNMIETSLCLAHNSVMLLSLQQFKLEQEYLDKLEEFLKRCQQKPTDTETCNNAVLLIQVSQAQRHGQLTGCAKHSLMNRLSEAQIEKLMVDKIVIGFLLSTERHVQVDGPAGDLTIQHTKESKIVYVDELRCISDGTSLISTFYGQTFSSILEKAIAELTDQKDLEGNIVQLVRECICESMTKIKSSNSGRHLQRIKILTALCSRSLSDMEVSNGFQRVLLKKMVKLYDHAQPNAKHWRHWITTEAMSPEHLQEGGTFGKTLHLQLKRILADLLAFIVSVIDENDNLDILFHPQPDAKWKIELWLHLFDVNAMQLESMEEVREYSIPSPRHLDGNLSSCFPFSFVINNMFLDVYDACKNAGSEIFFNMVQKKIEHGVITRELHSSNYFQMMEAYAHDVIKFLFHPGTDSELEQQNLVQILFEFSKQKWNYFRREIDGITITFHAYMEIFEHLKMLSSIFKVCPVAPKLDNSILDQPVSEFKVHEHALSDMLEWANEEVSCIDTEDSCVAWMATSNKIKHIFYTYLELIKSGEKRKELQEKWKPLCLLDLFLMNLLPGRNTETEFANYVRVIVSQAKRLLHGMRTLGLHGKSFLKIITNILKRCYINVRLNLLISWGSPDCKTCKKRIQIPVKLSCVHYLCNTCVENIVSSQTHKQCPICLAIFPEAFEPVIAELSQEQEKELAGFRANCTSFFLEYLDQFCFSAHAGDVHNDQVKRIFDDLLIFESKSPDNPEQLETEALDLNLATRSTIFQLLYRHNSELVSEEVDGALEELPFLQQKRFITCILKGLEDRLMKDESEKDPFKLSEDILRESWAKLIKSDGSEHVTLAMLHHLAGIRYALVNAVDCIQQERQEKNQGNDVPHGLLFAAVNVCKKSEDILGKFMVKVGLQVYGRDWLNFVLENKELKGVIPDKIVSLLRDESIDFWVLFGENYFNAKSALDNPSMDPKQIMSEWFPDNMDVSALEILPWIFAVNGCKTSARVTGLLMDKIGNCRVELDGLFKKSTHIAGTLKGVEGISTYESHCIYHLVMAVCGTVLCKPYMMESLILLITAPHEVEDLYWPAMPELLYISMSDVMTEEAIYMCPNGHPYFIGDCTYPWEVSRCSEPGCGARIGGIGHKEAAGNQRIDLQKDPPTGYQLSVERNGMDHPADRITQQAASVIQFFIHSCMLMGYHTKPREILRMVDKGDKDAVHFLVHKLKQNLGEMSRGLGRSTDDAMLIFFEILNQIRQKDRSQEQPDSSPDWTSRQERQQWEAQFREYYLLPVFQKVDFLLLGAHRNLNEAKNMNYAALCKITHDVETEEAPDMITYSHPCLWKTIRHSTTAHLLQTIWDSSRPGEVLQIILQTPNLHLVQHLNEVLKVQEMMIQRFQNKSDMDDVEKVSFEDVMQQVSYAESELLNEYIGVWNKVYLLLLKKQEFKSSASRKKFLEYIVPITKNSPVSMALPSSRGRGKCAKIMSKFLIGIQNEFLEACKKVIKNTESINDVEVSKLLPSHIVCIDKQKDLLPLLHLHTAYVMTENDQGWHHHISYNIDALEKRAREKFVMYKKLIKKRSLPCIKYTQDIGIGSDWDQVRKYTKQEPLPAKLVQEVDEVIQQVTSADVCEGVRTLTHAISFLAKIEGEPSRKLREYLENDLKLSPSHMAMIPKATLISHTLALYVRLTWYKSVNFVRQGLDPYKEALHGVTQVSITDPTVLGKLKDAFYHMDVTSLQQHLNEMLIRVPDFTDWWSLADILPGVEFIETFTTDSWYDRIPEEICFKHVSDLFRLSVKGIEISASV